MPESEAQARTKIDQALQASGWVVQPYRDFDSSASRGIALTEVPLKTGTTDYLLLASQKREVPEVERAPERGGIIESSRFSQSPARRPPPPIHPPKSIFWGSHHAERRMSKMTLHALEFWFKRRPLAPTWEQGLACQVKRRQQSAANQGKELYYYLDRDVHGDGYSQAIIQHKAFARRWRWRNSVAGNGPSRARKLEGTYGPPQPSSFQFSLLYI